jgi:hypothetical protein
MPKVTVLSSGGPGVDFIPDKFLHGGINQHEIRNSQSVWPADRWRTLRSYEIESLVKNQNTADNWDNILVTSLFDTSLIRNNRFFGLVRIGRVTDVVLRHHDLKLSAGITNSLIINCDIGDDAAIHNVQYLSHYIVGDRCILFNIMEMNTTDHAKFGNGIIKEGESEEVRVWIDIMNETGSRQVMPFDGMLPADAWIWGKYREDSPLQKSLLEMTQSRFDSRRGYYGTIGNESVLKNSHTLKDLKIGAGCYIKGANKLKNLTINSSEEEPTQIGEGVELVNGIIGYGCRIFYGCKAVRFILGNNSHLKYGARLINSILGDNSTISCCEVLNNLIFPAHEQHHNNSFLVASVIMGQSNIAAGATIGSNHNSRSNDSELIAGRGFWPGLCTSLKHSSRFASFTLIAKADYPFELDIPLPFALVSNNISADILEVMPAYWWMYNMYALARNSRKFVSRDIRLNKFQNIEFDFLAPDTIEEILRGMQLLEIWTAKASLIARGLPVDGKTTGELQQIGKELLISPENNPGDFEVPGEGIERSGRKVVILKTLKAYNAYRDMLHHYGVSNTAEYLNTDSSTSFKEMFRRLSAERETTWINLGGQLVKEQDLERLKSDIKSGILKTWEDVHSRYDHLWEKYPAEKQMHAYAVLCNIYNTDMINEDVWSRAIEKEIDIQGYIYDQVYLSRKKDYDNPFRIMIFRNEDEMKAVIGDVDDNDFIKQVRDEITRYIGYLEILKQHSLAPSDI